MGIFKSIQDKIRSNTAPAVAITEESVLTALATVQDPDLHKDIVALGFVKKLKIDAGKVNFDVELTTPACPVKEKIKSQCEEAVRQIPGVMTVEVNMTATTRGRLSAPTDQTHAALKGVRNLIAVASGKGGVGKSTTAVNLAYSLMQSGSKVGILDADVYGPSIPMMTRSGVPTTQQEGGLVIPPEVDGIKIISIGMFASGGKATILRGPMAGSVMKQFLTQIAWGDLDYLIIDYPPGTGDIQLTLSQTAPITGAVIVTTPQEVALIDVRKAVSMFETLKVPIIGIVETMSYFVCDGCDKKHFIFRNGGGERLSDELGIPLIGQIPLSSEVAEGGDKGTPMVKQNSDSAVAQAYNTAAGRLASQVSILHEKEAGALASFSIAWQKEDAVCQ